ncbi:unnamed protein product, partial [Ectocarpus sp. 12 AP-2014]
GVTRCAAGAPRGRRRGRGCGTGGGKGNRACGAPRQLELIARDLVFVAPVRGSERVIVHRLPRPEAFSLTLQPPAMLTSDRRQHFQRHVQHGMFSAFFTLCLLIGCAFTLVSWCFGGTISCEC